MWRAKYYDNIDTMPAYNYFQMVDGNLSYLVKKRGFFGNIVDAYDNIQRQIVDRFGISETFSEILELQREICELKCEIAITGDRFNNTFIKIKEAELERLVEIKSLSNDELKIILEKWLGFKLNLHKISVVEWYTYIKTYSQQQPKTQE